MFKRLKNNKGGTLVNMVVVMGIVGILSSAGISNYKALSNPLANASFSTQHFLKFARGQAMSNTRAFQVVPASSTRMSLLSGVNCDSTMTPVPGKFLDLPNGATIDDLAWSVCFNSRGLADSNVIFDLTGANGKVRTLSVALGGGVKVD